MPADTDRFGVGHGFNTAPSDGRARGDRAATAKIRDKAQLLAGMALEAAPETLTWSNGAWISGDGSDPAQVADDRGHRPVRARHRRAAAGRRGRPRRAGRLHATSSAGGRWPSIATSTSSRTLSAPNSAEYGLMPQSDCLSVRGSAACRRRRSRRRTRTGASPRAASGRPPPRARRRRRRLDWVERNVMRSRLSTSSSIVCWMFALSSSPSACMPPVPSITRSEAPSTVELEGRRRRGRRPPRAWPPRRSPGTADCGPPWPRRRCVRCAPTGCRRPVRADTCLPGSPRTERIVPARST